MGRQAKVAGRMDGTGSDLAVRKFPGLRRIEVSYLDVWLNFSTTYPGLPFTADLVQSLLSTYHQRAFHLQELQNFRKSVSQLLFCDTEYHSLRTSGIDKRSQNIEYRPEIELSPNGSQVC